MTVENCIRRYKEFVEKGNKKAAEDMKQHMLKAKKFKEHPFLKELEDKPKAKPKAKEKAKPKEKEDGPQPTR